MVSQTIHCSWLVIREGESDSTLLVTSCDTGRWVRLYIALDLWYRKVGQTIHCSWLAIREGEPDCILLLTSCDTGRRVRLNCSWPAIQDGESDYTLLLTCDTGRWARLYIACDFLRYKKVSNTPHCSWLLVIQAGESDSTFLKKVTCPLSVLKKWLIC